MGLIVHFDGGARGNPGPAGAGVVICDDDEKPLFEAGYFLGPLTNNAAEYNALLRSLERIALAPPQPVRLHSDSELLVRQITGEYQVKSPALEQLYMQAQRLLLRISHWSIRHVRRDANRRADQLANLAMDERRDVVVLDRLSPAAPSASAGDVNDDDARTRPAAAKSRVVDAGTGASDAAHDAPATARPAAGAKSAKPTGDAGSARPASGEKTDAPPAGKPARDARPQVDPLSGPLNALSDGDEHAAERRVRVACGCAPADGACPSPPAVRGGWDVASTVPAGMCLSAAQAILPTLLAIQNAGSEDFLKIPTLAVRCTRPGCGATFTLTPLAASNGRPAS
ncbi:MAG: reverse transcriptase-like protein [Phycisphaerales bacterium]|nr:reverse transcriptase-like protein [Phycisphaerales bacterium]